MQIKNSSNHYGLVAIMLHWVMAIIIIGLLCLGLYMTGLPTSPQKIKFYGWHKEFGALVFMLAALRILWYVANIKPSLSMLNTLERFGARAAHWALYGFMFALPLTGWLMSSASGFPVSFFGLFILPDLIAPNDEARHLFAQIHEWLAYGLIAIIILHVLAALKHYLIDRDDILQRMLP